MKHLTNQHIELYVTETGLEYRFSAHEGQYDLYIVQTRADHFELSIEEYGNTIHDSVPFASLLVALKAADEMIAEMEAMNAEAASNAYTLIVEKVTSEALDQIDLIFNEREFLLEMVDNPFPALFEKHLLPGAAEAFEIFKREEFILLSFSDDKYRITNKGRLHLGIEVDPHL